MGSGYLSWAKRLQVLSSAGVANVSRITATLFLDWTISKPLGAAKQQHLKPTLAGREPLRGRYRRRKWFQTLGLPQRHKTWTKMLKRGKEDQTMQDRTREEVLVQILLLPSSTLYRGVLITNEWGPQSSYKKRIRKLNPKCPCLRRHSKNLPPGVQKMKA